MADYEKPLLHVLDGSNNKIPVTQSMLGGGGGGGGSVSVSNFPSTFAATQSGAWTVSTGISQPLTDTQLRAIPVPVSMATAPAGLAFLSTETITRAANTTPYTVNDVYGDIFQLQNIGASGGFVFISSIEIIFNLTALPTGMSGFAVYLYSGTPPSAITDNLPFSLGSADRASSLTPGGIILTASLARGGGSVVAEALSINRLIKLANGSTSLWGYLVTLGAFTPAANSETATITVEAFAP